MGMCLHQDVTEEAKKAKVQSIKIESALSEQAKNEMNVVKILMLGAAESGKSTLVKQIKIMYSKGFSKQELMSFKPAVLDNLLMSMKCVLRGMGMLRIDLADKNNKAHARCILSCSQCFGEERELLPFVAFAFCALWADQGVRAAAARGYEFQLNDSAFYTWLYVLWKLMAFAFGVGSLILVIKSFFENLSRIIAPNYMPTETDVLRVRVRTCGIIETQFRVKEIAFRMYDVGGQRSDRRKWLSCFDCVRAVVFVVALTSYDMTLTEDSSKNRLLESLKLFASVCTNPIFKSSSLILFMNKTDLFRTKILHSERHLRLYFPCYRGANADVDAAARHISAMFAACNTIPQKLVYEHFTIATDTSNVQVVFQFAMDQIVKENLADVSLL